MDLDDYKKKFEDMTDVEIEEYLINIRNKWFMALYGNSEEN